MNKYGEAAIKAVEMIQTGKEKSPIDAWKSATNHIFGEGNSSQSKSCPKDTFLSICETGSVKGIDVGKYTRSIKNRSYALKALDLINENSDYAEDPEALWMLVQGESVKVHNAQMNVVIAMWNADLIEKRGEIDENRNW